MITRTETVEKTIYIAADGTEFSKARDCVQYEAKLKINAFKGISPCVCINELSSGEIVQDERVSAILNYFHIPQTPYAKIYKAEIKDKKDLDYLITFCECRTGVKYWEKADFKENEKYIICTIDVSTMIDGYRERVLYVNYQKIVAFYENILENLRGIF